MFWRIRRVLTKTAAVRVAGIATLIAAISVLRYATAPSNLLHELSLRLYYLPILIGAYWYGAPGGLVVALVSSLAYVHRMLDVGPAFDASRYAEVVVFYVIGLSVGLLASAQRQVAARYQRTAATLESANRQLRESHEQIRRMDRLKTLGEVAAGLTHEIRHPLASISGALEIIDARALDGSPEREFSGLAMAEVRRLERLVWEFLKYARPREPELRTMPLDDIVAQVVVLLRMEAERGRVRLEIERQIPLDVVMDPLQIEQVLLNVVLNAVQATPPGGGVVVRQQRDGEDAIIDVADEGSGIAAEHLPNIFSPFFTTKDQGTGLGLAIAQHIVLAHQGRLDVHNTSPRGTTFRLRLPLDRTSRATAVRAPAELTT